MAVARRVTINWLSHVEFPAAIKQTRIQQHHFQRATLFLSHNFAPLSHCCPPTFQINLLHNHARAKVKVVSNDANDLAVGLVTRSVGIHVDGQGLGDTNGIGYLITCSAHKLIHFYNRCPVSTGTHTTCSLCMKQLLCRRNSTKTVIKRAAALSQGQVKSIRALTGIGITST